MAKKKEKEPDRILLPGKPDLERCDNKVVSARYTIYNFIPVVSDQSKTERRRTTNTVMSAATKVILFYLFEVDDLGHSTVPSRSSLLTSASH